MIAEPTAPIEIFICYAREDEMYRQSLEKQLRILNRQGLITVWHDREIIAGTEWQSEIDKHLKSAQIILLLVSPDFMDSDYCYGIEMQNAMERHRRGEAHVIPIIVRSVYWQDAPFGKLQVLPTDAKPIVGQTWHNLDDAFYDVAKGIREVINKVKEEQRRRAEEERQRKLKEEQQRRAEEERQRRLEEEQQRRAEKERQQKVKGEQQRQAEEERQRKIREEQERRTSGDQLLLVKEEQIPTKSSRKLAKKRLVRIAIGTCCLLAGVGFCVVSMTIGTLGSELGVPLGVSGLVFILPQNDRHLQITEGIIVFIVGSLILGSLLSYSNGIFTRDTTSLVFCNNSTFPCNNLSFAPLGVGGFFACIFALALTSFLFLRWAKVVGGTIMGSLFILVGILSYVNSNNTGNILVASNLPNVFGVLCLLILPALGITLIVVPLVRKAHPRPKA